MRTANIGCDWNKDPRLINVLLSGYRIFPFDDYYEEFSRSARLCMCGFDTSDSSRNSTERTKWAEGTMLNSTLGRIEGAGTPIDQGGRRCWDG